MIETTREQPDNDENGTNTEMYETTRHPEQLLNAAGLKWNTPVGTYLDGRIQVLQVNQGGAAVDIKASNDWIHSLLQEKNLDLETVDKQYNMFLCLEQDFQNISSFNLTADKLIDLKGAAIPHGNEPIRKSLVAAMDKLLNRIADMSGSMNSLDIFSDDIVNRLKEMSAEEERLKTEPIPKDLDENGVKRRSELLSLLVKYRETYQGFIGTINAAHDLMVKLQASLADNEVWSFVDNGQDHRGVVGGLEDVSHALILLRTKMEKRLAA